MNREAISWSIYHQFIHQFTLNTNMFSSLNSFLIILIQTQHDISTENMFLKKWNFIRLISLNISEMSFATVPQINQSFNYLWYVVAFRYIYHVDNVDIKLMLISVPLRRFLVMCFPTE